MAGYSKKVKTHFRKLIDEAYERELARELAQLRAQFDERRAGRIKAIELSPRVHQFDKGPAHEMHSLYNLMDQEFVLERAVVEAGSLKKPGHILGIWCDTFASPR